jgi:pyruvate formate lyase activating enzyme
MHKLNCILLKTVRWSGWPLLLLILLFLLTGYIMDGKSALTFHRLPLYFSRFHPQHKLAYLTPTPVETLVKAREAARGVGLRYVYVGNVPGLEGAGTTWCPHCKKPVVERDIFVVTGLNLADGKCRSCGTRIAGVWS